MTWQSQAKNAGGCAATEWVCDLEQVIVFPHCSSLILGLPIGGIRG